MVHRLAFPLVALLLIPLALAAQAPDSVASPSDAGPKRVLTARALGVVPGAGHFYADEPGRGLAFLGGMLGTLLVGSVGTAASCVGDALTGTGEETCEQKSGWNVTSAIVLGLWGWSIFDAGRAARRTNAKLASRRVMGSVTLIPRRTAEGRSRTGLGFTLAVPFR